MAGNYLYVSSSAKLSIYDVTVPSSPALISTYTTGLSGNGDVYVQGKYAYLISNSNNTLVILNVSNPAAPTLVGSTTSGLGNPQNVVVQGRYAYIANVTSTN